MFCKEHRDEWCIDCQPIAAEVATAIDAYRAAIWAEAVKVVEAATALVADVRRRYPGEELRCEFMRRLDDALRARGADK